MANKYCEPYQFIPTYVILTLDFPCFGTQAVAGTIRARFSLRKDIGDGEEETLAG